MTTTHTTELNTESFEKAIDRDGITLVDWWAPWCGPCRAFGPVYEKVAARHPAITFSKVNTEDEPELAGAFRIRSIPTLMVFRDRVLVYTQPGMLPESVLEDLIGKVAKLDMDEVRRKLAENEQAGQQSATA